MTDNRRQLVFGNGGWIWIGTPQLEAGVYLRVADDDGRLVLRELYLGGADTITTTTLREVPLGNLDGIINAPAVSKRIRSGMAEPGPDVATALNHLARRPYYTEDGAPVTWVDAMLDAQGADVGEFSVRPTKPPRRFNWTTATPPPVDARLDVPDAAARPWPDAFYEAFARIYTALVASGVRYPGAAIADANGVQVTQVHRWTRVARSKGFLERATQGKAG